MDMGSDHLLLSKIQAFLFLLTIALATYAIIDITPRERRGRRTWAFAGSFLALFTTFFITTIQMDRIKDEVRGLSGLLTVNESLKSMSQSEDLVCKASFEMVSGRITRLDELVEKHSATLSDWEAIEFIAKLINVECSTGCQSLRIVAASPNPQEFVEGTPISILEYDQAIAQIAKLREGNVHRVYILQDTLWNDVREAKAILESGDSEVIKSFLNGIDLSPLAKHYKQQLHFEFLGL